MFTQIPAPAWQSQWTFSCYCSKYVNIGTAMDVDFKVTNYLTYSLMSYNTSTAEINL